MTDVVEWGVLFKCRTPAEEPAPEQAALERVVAALSSVDKRLTGGGRDFTVWFWTHAADASAATRVGAAELRAAAAAEGLPPLHVVRSHSASSNGRISPFPGVATRIDRTEEWSVLYRVQLPPGEAPVDARTMRLITGQLSSPDAFLTLHSDKEKFLVSDGSAFTARCWAPGSTPDAALLAGRADLLQALDAVGAVGWTIVRAQVVTAEARRGDTFPGADDRTLTETEETR